MYAALYVVEKVDEYPTDAEKYLAKNPLPIADELLKFNRPRTEWKYEDLAATVEKMDHGRSFNNGKQIFAVANCVACHRVNGVGIEIGADLTKLEPKFLTTKEVLKKILEPSSSINEKYQQWIIETNEGKIITGLIVEEKGDTLKILDNPLAKAAPITLKTTDIANKRKSPSSIMPKGLLDQMTREEI